MFRAFRAGDQPTTIKFAGGREEPLPDLTSMMKPSALGDVATYTLLGFGGLFLGGETGLVTGSFRARSSVSKDPESQQRIEKAFRRYVSSLSCYVQARANTVSICSFRADVLRKQADQLDRQDGGFPF